MKGPEQRQRCQQLPAIGAGRTERRGEWMGGRRVVEWGWRRQRRRRRSTERERGREREREDEDEKALRLAGWHGLDFSGTTWKRFRSKAKRARFRFGACFDDDACGRRFSVNSK